MTTTAIAMATFNGEAYLAEQLASLARQTSPPVELIVIDDGSSDGTIGVLESFCETAPFPVEIYKNPQRMGYRASFIKAANLCSAEIIAFCDQDDIWSPIKIEMLQRAFDESPETLLVYHNSMVVNERLVPLTMTFARWTPSHTIHEPNGLSPCLIIPGHAQAFRRILNVVANLHSDSIDPYAPNEVMPHDMWVPFWASSLGRVKYLSDALVRYRTHDLNTSGWHLSWWAFAADHIRNALVYVCANRMSAIDRERLLRRGRELFGHTQLPMLDAAIAFYRKFKTKTTKRVLIYERPSIVARARAFLTFVKDGNYEWDERCHGAQAFLLDIAVGVFCRELGRPKD